MDDVLNKALMIIITLAATFLLTSTILLVFFNAAYNYVVTNLATATTQGLLLFVLFIGLIAIILAIIKSTTAD